MTKKKYNIDVFILARLDSKRLPKKQLKKINNQHLIKILVERLKKSKKVRNVIVCTTIDKTDDPLVKLLKTENILFFRGSKKDVLKRMLDAAEKFNTEKIIDVEGDKIYTDLALVDKISNEISKKGVDFVIGKRKNEYFDPADHFIHGVVPTGFSKTILRKICDKKKTRNTETGYKEIFLKSNLCNVKFLEINNIKKITKNIRLTLDYPEDYELAKKIFSEIGSNFDYHDIITLYSKKPEIFKNTLKISEKWKKEYEKNRVKQ